MSSGEKRIIGSLTVISVSRASRRISSAGACGISFSTSAMVARTLTAVSSTSVASRSQVLWSRTACPGAARQGTRVASLCASSARTRSSGSCARRALACGGAPGFSANAARTVADGSAARFPRTAGSVATPEPWRTRAASAVGVGGAG